MPANRSDDQPRPADGSDAVLVDLAREALDLAGRVCVRLGNRPPRPAKPGDEDRARA